VRLALVEVVGQAVGGADLAAPQPVQAGVDHDPVQPGGDRRVTAVGRRPPEGRDHRVLERVGGFVRVAGGAQGHGPEPVAVPSVQRTERVPIPGQVGGDQVPVGALLAHERTEISATLPL
jgi:hypothetical protein